MIRLKELRNLTKDLDGDIGIYVDFKSPRPISDIGVLTIKSASTDVGDDETKKVIIDIQEE